MRRWMTVWMTAGLLAACAATPVRDEVNLVSQLRRQADAWDQAIVRKDEAAIAANMAESFRHIDARGRLNDRAAFLAGIVSDKLTIEPYTVEDFSVRVYDDVALVSGATDMQGSYDGRAFRSHYRFTDIYVRENGRWQVVQVQITDIAE